MVAIDSVTIAANTLAASSVISRAFCACANSTKPNSPPWLSSRPSASAPRQVMRETRPSPKITSALVTISASAMPNTNTGSLAIAPRSSSMPTERKNSPSRIERNGSTSASSSWRYGESASITPATNAPNAVLAPIICITPAAATTVNSAATMNISRSPSPPISRNSGRIRNRPAAISMATAASVSSAVCHPGGPFMSAGLRLIAATIVISGMIDRSWNSRIANARSPNGVRSRPADCSSGSTCAVDDSASGSPSASAAASEKWLASTITPVTASPHSATCASPSPKISRFIRHSRDGLSSSPTMNSSSVIPSSATPISSSASPTSPRMCGPTTAPATR